MANMTLGSLFDGSGGFPLAGLLCGVTPLWASEIEPFPIRVTTKRLPQMKHLGDINKIDGGSVPPVDIITGGFCCQDLSVAGKRLGLHGERSGLFFQIIRIIKEMRQATENIYPKFVVLENVPGMYSSAGGTDFLEVLNELIQIKDETLSIPMPEKGKWSTSGEIVGDGFSLGWRTLDAQFWGVAQRRRRLFIVVDFTGERAGKILFDETRLRGHPPQGGYPWKAAAGNFADCFGNPISVLNDQGGACMDVSENITGTLRAQEHGHQPIVFQSAGFCPEQSAKTRGVGYEEEISPTLRTGAVPGSVLSFEPGITSRLGRKGTMDITPTLRADMGDNQLAVVIENHPADSRVKVSEDGVVQTLSQRMGTGGGNVPMVCEPKTLKIRSGCEGGGKGALIQDNLSATLSTGNDQTVFIPKAYGICSKSSNSMMSDNPHSGIYEADTSRTLDTSVPDPNKNAGGMAIVALEGNGARPSHKGSGFSEEGISYTLNSVEQHSVSYAMTTGCYTQVCEEQSPTLQARDYKDAPIVNRPQHVVRRLTPSECALLQGFSPDWCAGLETPEPTEEDIAFWSGIWETHRRIIGKSKKPKSRNQIIKWLKNPHSDSKEYAMWGNGICLNCGVFVLGGIVYYGQLHSE